MSILMLGLSGCFVEQPKVGDSYLSSRVLFSHDGLGASCIQCHEADRKAPSGGVVHGNGGDCVTCHMPANSWATSLLAGASVSHTPTPATCITCHSGKVPAGLVQRFDHSISGTGDCVECHLSSPGISWAGGTYDHIPNPTTCQTCHASNLPLILVSGFSHSSGGQGDCVSCHLNPGVSWSGASYNHSPAPTSCLNCHAGKRPTGVVSGFDHSVASAQGDCISCHSNPGVSWTGGAFSHSPAPTTCSNCHTSARPVGVVSGFNHANGGMGDCKSCHTASVGVSWAGGAYNHSPSPTSCSDCHLSARPTGLVGGFNHANGGTGDCINCHHNPGVSWTGGAYNHSPAPTSCASCHAASMPVAVVQRFDHTIIGASDCVSCHTHPGSTWTGGTYGHSPVPGNCASCHLVDKPAAVVSNFSHSTIGTTDCKSCHTSNIGTSWTGGVFSHSPVPTSCATCHSGSRPTTAIYPQSKTGVRVTVPGHYGTTDCQQCHRAQSVSVTVFNWNHYSAATVKTNTCLPCHEGRRPSGHHTGQDCKSCHSSLTTWNN